MRFRLRSSPYCLALLRLGRRFYVPLIQWLGKRICNLDRKLGFAGSGLALDQNGTLESDRRVDGQHQIVCRDVGTGSTEFPVGHALVR